MSASVVRDIIDLTDAREPHPSPLTLSAFLNLKLPPRRNILKPWLPEKGLAMIYSLRGVGKTHLALAIGYAIATGGALLDWQAVTPRRVLYVDGEMPSTVLQERLRAIVGGVDAKPPSGDYFRLLSADLEERGLPDLATTGGQYDFDGRLAGAEVLILDNISTLCRSGKENEAESWDIVQQWALTHRRQGRSLVFVHHAGKGGAQRGTSKREDVLDTVISLRRPLDYRTKQGARFEIHFEKARGFAGTDAEAFEARYETCGAAALWTRTSIADADLSRVAAALNDGMSIRETAEQLGIHKSRVERLKAKAATKGLLTAEVEQPGDVSPVSII